MPTAHGWKFRKIRLVVLWVKGARGAWRCYDELARLDVRRLEKMSLVSSHPVHDQLVGCCERDLVGPADRLPFTIAVEVCFKRWSAPLAKADRSHYRAPLSRLIALLR